MRRILIATVVVLMSLPATAAAGRGDAVRIKLEGVRHGAVLEGTVSLTATASSAAGIKRIEIEIAGQVVEAAEPPELEHTAEISYVWVTPFQIGSSDLALNGEYPVVARAITNGGAGAVTNPHVTVDNPAAPPTGLTATATSRGVELRWDTNPEPDLLGYQVERKRGGDFKAVARTAETVVVDPVGSGTYSYRVLAIRSSTVHAGGRASAPSQPVQITLADPRSGGDTDAAAGRIGTGGFGLGGRALGPAGLPLAARLPGQTGLPRPPGRERWGTFDKELPYEIPKGGIPLSAMRAGREAGSSTLIPPDGLRWMGAGALLIALAVLLRSVARRVGVAKGPSRLDL